MRCHAYNLRQEAALSSAIADVLPLAAAVALFPIPMLVVILLLFSDRAKTNVPAFLVGWVGGLTAVVTISALLTGGYESAVDDAGDHGVDLVRIGLGAVVLLLAFKKWLGRPTGDDDPEMPGWMSAIATATPVRALGFGVFLSALNPKNIAIGFGAGTAIGQPYLSLGEAIAVGFVFVLTASAGVLGPVVYSGVAGAPAQAQLAATRDWLVKNNAIVMTVLMLLIGTVLISEGLRGY